MPRKKNKGAGATGPDADEELDETVDDDGEDEEGDEELELTPEEQRDQLVTYLVETIGYSQEQAEAIADKKAFASTGAGATEPSTPSTASRSAASGSISVDCGDQIYQFRRHFYGPGVVGQSQDGVPVTKECAESISGQKTKIEALQASRKEAEEKRRAAAVPPSDLSGVE